MADFLVTQLDPAFLDHLAKLQDISGANADAVCAGTQRKWLLPPTSAWSGDPMDIPGMNHAFDRTALNNLYIAVVSDTQQRGRQGEAGILKIQVDYIAALERAFRTRQASSVRCKIHAAARR